MPQNEKSKIICCDSGLGPDTLLLVENQLIKMSQFRIAYSEMAVSTFCINPTTSLVDTCNIVGIAQEIYVSRLIEFKLHFGFNLTCTPETNILTSSGYKKAGELKKDDVVKIYIFNQETNVISVDEGIITEYSDRVVSLQTPVCYFFTDYQNILLPYYNEGSSCIAFVDVKQ